MRRANCFIFVIGVIVIFSISFADAGQGNTPRKKLIVGTKVAPPFSMKNSDGSWTGISIDLWREISEELELNYEFRELDLKGLIEGISDGTLDLSVAALTITMSREQRLDFTHPFYTTGLGIAVKSRVRNPWLTIAKRFLSAAFLKVIAVLGLLLLVVGLLVWWFEHKKNFKDFGGSTTNGIGSGFWWSAVTMTTVGYGDKAPRTLGGRIIALIWMFASIIVISSFTAAITSSLTVSKLEPVISKPEDLPYVRVGSVENSTSEDYLKANGIEFQQFNTAVQGLIALARENIDAFIYDAPMLRFLIKQSYHGMLEVLPATLLRQDYGIALPEGSSLREPINRVLLSKISAPKWQLILSKYIGE